MKKDKVRKKYHIIPPDQNLDLTYMYMSFCRTKKWESSRRTGGLKGGGENKKGWWKIYHESRTGDYQGRKSMSKKKMEN